MITSDQTGRQRERAFTLIELLVVIAIIALLIGILLPSLGSARNIARSVVCQTRHKSMATGQSVYMLDNEDYYAGRNTSGLFFRIDYLLWITDPEENTPTTPTTWMDWISPVLGTEMSMPIPRPERTMFIFNSFADPASIVYNNARFGNASDRDRFEELIFGIGVRQISYLSPASFHYYPTTDAANRASRRTTVRTKRFGNRHPEVAGFDFTTEFQAPDRFIPRVDIVARDTTSKVISHCGTRFYDPRTRELDFDISPTPTYFGSFHSSSPSYNASTEFGREFWQRRGAPGPDLTNVDLTFRHPSEALNAGMFDGSVRVIKSPEAWSDPAPWWPSGSVYTGRGEPTPEIQAKFSVGDELP